MAKISIDEYVRRNLERRSNSWSAKQTLNRAYRREGPRAIVPVQITENDIILGCNDFNFNRDNLVVLNTRSISPTGERFAFTFAILGMPGTGKTQTARNLVLANLHGRLGKPAFVYDPKGEWGETAEPYDEHVEKIDAFFAHLPPGIKRQGYDCITMSPYYTNKRTDVRFKVQLQDLKDIMEHSEAGDPDEGLRVTCELLGIGSEQDLAIDLLRICLKPAVKSWAELNVQIKKYAQKYPAGSALLLRKLFFARRNSLISDNPADACRVLENMAEGKVVVYRGKIKGSETGRYVDLQFNACLKIVLYKIEYNCEAWNMHRDRSAVLKAESIVVFFEEIDQLASNTDSSTRIAVRNFVSKGRSFGIDVGICGQEYATIDAELFGMIKNVFSSRVTEGNAVLLRKRNMQQDDIQNLMSMPIKVMTSVDTEVALWFCIDEAGNLLGPYRPIPPTSKSIKIRAS